MGTEYSPGAYSQRVNDFLEPHEPLGRHQAPLEIAHLRARLRSILLLGVVVKERLHYWRLFFWSLLRRPRQFSTAIILAIYGFHFWRIFELHV